MSDKAESEEMTPISSMGYEECRDELIEVVRLLEQGGLDLDASLQLWEKGEKLARRCNDHLAGARQRVEDALAADGADDERPRPDLNGNFGKLLETRTRFSYYWQP